MTELAEARHRTINKNRYFHKKMPIYESRTYGNYRADNGR